MNQCRRQPAARGGRQAAPSDAVAAALREANSLLSDTELHTGDVRWLRGELVDVMISPVGPANGGKQAIVLTVFVRAPSAVGLAGTAVSLTDRDGQSTQLILDGEGQARAAVPAGPYWLALSRARARARVGAASPRPPSQRRRRRLGRGVPVGAAVVAALALLVSTMGQSPAIATVDLHPVDCANTTGRSTSTHVVVAAVWAGEERERFKDVLERFETTSGDEVTFATDDPEADRALEKTLNAFIEKGCPPDVALLPQPGLLKSFAGDGKILPVEEFAGDLIAANYTKAWQEAAEFEGRSYGVWFKAANKSMIWYNAELFERAGITSPPDTWDALMTVAQRLLDAGITPFSVAGAEKAGWTLTDWFENVYLKMWGGDMYNLLARNEIAWTDRTVTAALAKLGEIFGKPGWVAEDALETTYEESVAKVFPKSERPEAAMVFEGDFVANEIAKSNAKIGVDAKFFAFPSSGGSTTPVVGAGTRSEGGPAFGGDVAVMLHDTPAARRFMLFLAGPEAAEPWVRAGGFTSPNIQVGPETYPDEASGEMATALANAERIRFDLSDQLPPAFGSDPERGQWVILRDFLRHPERVDDVARQLQEACVAAGLKCGGG